MPELGVKDNATKISAQGANTFNKLAQLGTSDDIVGLSYSPYLTANQNENIHHDVQLNLYKWGESTIRIKESYVVDVNESRAKPPKNEGERIRSTLSRRGKSRIKKAARFYQYLAESKNKKKGYATMITLVFGKHYPSDKQAKKLLDIFLKRLRRFIPAKEFHYCWVAEKQKRGALHFHILTPEYVAKEWINENWNQVVNNWYARNDQHDKIQTLYPNVIAVYNAGAYLVKYLQKEGENIAGNGYNMSQATSEAIKPEVFTARKVEHQQVERIISELSQYSPYTYQNESVAIHWLQPKHKQWIQSKLTELTKYDYASETTNELTFHRRQPSETYYHNISGVISGKQENTRILQEKQNFNFGLFTPKLE